MAATIITTSMGVLINGTLTLGDHHELFEILDAEEDFAARLKQAISEKFVSLCADHAEAFVLSGGGRADFVMAYLHQMTMCTTLLGALYPQYLHQISIAENS